MPPLDRNELVKVSNKRHFIQWNGSSPVNRLFYAGVDTQYVKIEGATQPERADVEPTYMHDPYRPGSYRLVSRQSAAPDLPGYQLMATVKRGSVTRWYGKIGCLTAYTTSSDCLDPSDLYAGVSDYLTIYSNGIVTTKEFGTESAWGDSDDLIEMTADVTPAAIYAVGALNFGDVAGPQADVEVIDLVYANDPTCQACDTADLVTRRMYAITRAFGASPGNQMEVLYSIDGGANWLATGVTTAAVGTEDPAAIRVVGNFVMVVSPTAAAATQGGYHYAAITAATGAPGTWTEFSGTAAGFPLGNEPRDVYVVSSSEFYFACDGGYVLRGLGIGVPVTAVHAGTATTQDLGRITGMGQTLVAVGAASAILISNNRGASWATTAQPVAALTFTAVALRTESEIWVGSSTGRLFYSVNGGVTWTESSFEGTGTGAIRDIRWISSEVAIVSHDISTVAYVLHTLDCGRTWVRSANTWRSVNLVTNAQRFNRIALPDTSDLTTRSNNVLLGGLSATTDGTIQIGIASRY